MKLNVNTKAVNGLTTKLIGMHKSAFPSAVRNTLNDAAFKTKELIPKKAGQNFTVRQKNLFKSFTGVDKASGFDVKSMVSKVGLDTSKPRTSKLVEGLEKQETGGNIHGRKLTPHDKGRVSGSYGKKLKAKNRFDKINVHDSTHAYRANKGSRGSKFVAAVMSANKRGSKYMLLKKGNKGTVFEISGVSTNISTRKLKFKLTPIYNYRNSKTSRVKAMPYIAPSSKLAARKMEDFYLKNATFQFKKYMK